MPETIVITKRSSGGFFVVCGDRFSTLAQDETLWVVAEFLAGRIHRHMKTESQVRDDGAALSAVRFGVDVTQEF